MSTVTTWQIESTSSAATEQLGERLGKQLRGGEIIELVSDLGGGKTTFVRGLARGIGSHDRVGSPSFTVSKVYKAGTLELHHFDFYRLPDAGIMEHELHDLLGDLRVVVVIEWADVVKHVLPAEHMTIRISVSGEESRNLSFEYPKSYAKIVEAVC